MWRVGLGACASAFKPTMRDPLAYCKNSRKVGCALRASLRRQTPLLHRTSSTHPAAAQQEREEAAGCIESSHGSAGQVRGTTTCQRASHFNEFRQPIGLQALNGALKTAAKAATVPLSQLTVLDAGCGTGNYISVLKQLVGTVHGLELNDTMLNEAKRMHSNDSRVHLHQGSIMDMSNFAESTFDTVIITQALHHLAPDTHADAFAEVVRVLKPGGTFWLSTQTPHQHMDGFWWTPIVPQSSAILAARFQGLHVLQGQLADAGLVLTDITVPSSPLVRDEAYLDVEGPFQERWRNANSTFLLASRELGEELERGLRWWRRKIDDGDAEAFLQKREALRADVGQTTAVTCVKPMTNNLKKAAQQATLPPIRPLAPDDPAEMNIEAI